MANSRELSSAMWSARVFSNALFFSLSVLTCFVLSSPSAIVFADERVTDNADTFVQQNINQAIAILNDPSNSDDLRYDKFSSFILTVTDMNRIALFTLGPYGRGASDGDIKAFTSAFTEYASAVYEQNLAKYKGKAIKVIGSAPRSPSDYIVNAVASGSDGKRPIDLAFHVSNDSGHFVLLDAQVEGFWLADYERSQFESILQQSHGNIPALSAYVAEQGKKIRSGRTTSGPDNQ
jgi:phospholipid transport system substrate-binding protein